MYQRAQNKNSLKLIRKVSLFFFFFLSIFLFFTVKENPVSAETCTYSVHSDCSGGVSGCDYTTSHRTVGCTLQGDNSCPDPLYGNRCDRGGYFKRYIPCSANADGTYYSCGTPSTTRVNAGFCGCSSDPNPDPDPPTPSECQSCSCSFGCGGSGTCVPNPGACGYSGDPPQANSACRSCPDKCCKPKCSCSPSCTSPTGLNVDNVSNAPVDDISWDLTYWGLDSGKSKCSGDKCSHNSFSDEGKYRLYSGSTNITNICKNFQTDDGGYFLPQDITKCEITNMDALNRSWPSTTQTFRLVAENKCGSVDKNFNVTWAPDEKPFCGGINYNGDGIQFRDELLATNPSEKVTYTVTAGDPDPYGPPTWIDVCYAVRNQSESFYRTGGSGNSWVCIGAQHKTNTYTFERSFNDLKVGYANVTSNYSGSMDDNGFLLSVNVRNNMTGNFCATNVGFNNGDGAYWPDMETVACDGGSCTLNIHDRAPEIVKVGMEDTSWVGHINSPDLNTDQYSCTNNNPVTYQMEVTDPDTSRDIDLLELVVANPNDVRDNNNDNIFDNTISNRYWPLRIRFAKEWRAPGGQRFANGNFMVRDMTVKTNTQTSRKCIDVNQNIVDFEPQGWDSNDPDCRFSNNRSCTSYNARFGDETVFCYAYDDHTWEGSAFARNQRLSIDGSEKIVDVYYLANGQDIRVDNEGYNSRILGNSNWRDSTYVAYESRGNRVWAQFKVEYLDDGNQTWNGEYKNVWYARDLYEREDKTENLSGSYKADTTWGNTFHIKGDTRIDLTPPSTNIETIGITNASTLDVNWRASDPLSGVDYEWGEARHSLPSSSSPICRQSNAGSNCTPGYVLTSNNDPTVPSSSALWRSDLTGSTPADKTGKEYINIGDNEEGTINFFSFAVDQACNLSEGSDGKELAKPWLLTRAGLVYSGGKPSIGLDIHNPSANLIADSLNRYPYDILRGEINLSTELLSTGDVIDTGEIVNNSGKPYQLTGYTDNNNDNPWFEDIYKSTQNQMATRKDEFATSLEIPFTTISGNVSSLVGNTCSNPNLNCVLRTSTSVTVNNDLSCNRRTIIFVDGSLTIDGDITASGVSNGCIFVVQGNVVVQDMDPTNSRKSPNNATYPSYDTLESFIISMGSIYVEEVDTDASVEMRDGLKVSGGFIAFGRGPGGSSVLFERSLKLRNNLDFPAEVLVHDPRYFQIAEELMGNTDDTYKQDIGFKP